MKTFITGAVGACLLLPVIGSGVQAEPRFSDSTAGERVTGLVGALQA